MVSLNYAKPTALWLVMLFVFFVVWVH